MRLAQAAPGAPHSLFGDMLRRGWSCAAGQRAAREAIAADAASWAVPVAAGTRQVSDDAERQDKVELSQEELLEAVLAGAFAEVKWTATVALSLLRLPSSRDRQGT